MIGFFLIEWDEQKDVVVIGSGLAGLCSAIEANRAGDSVTVIEKMKATGGNTLISDGGVAAATFDSAWFKIPAWVSPRERPTTEALWPTV